MKAVASSLLSLATLALGAVFACALPLVALATAAARTLPAALAYGTVGLTWLVDQSLGFTVRHYPRDGSTVAWGVVLGFAALAAVFAARRAPTFALAFVWAFVVDQGITIGYGALVHTTHAFEASVVARIAAVDVLCLAILAPVAYAPAAIARLRREREGTRVAR